MRLNPGSFVWLLVHDLRINWRGFTEMFRGGSSRAAGLVLLASALFLHLLAWPAVRWLAPMLHGQATGVAPIAAALGAAFTWMVAQSLFAATRTLYDRADLDLLLASPLPPSRIVAAKALAIATGTLGSIAMIALPVADMGILLDSPAWASLYPILAALALIATSLGLCLSMALFAVFGPRRARMYAQLTGASLGGAFVLGAQIYAMLPAATRESLAVEFSRIGGASLAHGSLVLSLPVNNVHGMLLTIAALLALGVLCFAATVVSLGKRFAIAAVAAAGAPTEASKTQQRSLKPSFGAGAARNLRAKELRLMMRDPSLFAQLGLQIIYTIPIAVVLLRSQLVPTAFALVPTVVMIAAQVAGSIAWITVSGEDAPELIATAPVSTAAVDRAKLGAVVLPILVLLLLPLTGLAVVSWRLALVALLFAAGASASTSLLNFWHPMPGNRRGMLRRHSQSKLIGLVEHGLAMLWAFAVVFALVGSAIVLIPLAAVAGILAFFRHKHISPKAAFSV